MTADPRHDLPFSTLAEQHINEAILSTAAEVATRLANLPPMLLSATALLLVMIVEAPGATSVGCHVLQPEPIFGSAGCIDLLGDGVAVSRPQTRRERLRHGGTIEGDLALIIAHRLGKPLEDE